MSHAHLKAVNWQHGGIADFAGFAAIVLIDDTSPANQVRAPGSQVLRRHSDAAATKCNVFRVEDSLKNMLLK